MRPVFISHIVLEAHNGPGSNLRKKTKIGSTVEEGNISWNQPPIQINLEGNHFEQVEADSGRKQKGGSAPVHRKIATSGKQVHQFKKKEGGKIQSRNDEKIRILSTGTFLERFFC